MNLVRVMGLESSSYSCIQIAMTTGSDPGFYCSGGGGYDASRAREALCEVRGMPFQQILQQSAI